MEAGNRWAAELERYFWLFGGNRLSAFVATGCFVKCNTNFPEHFLCSITLEVMEDPVQTCDGMSFERSAITEWLRKHDTSPMTNMKLPNKTIVPNLALRQELDRLAQDM